jgi:RNA polymerase sigma-70 factor (ECF subfamily)
MNASPFTLAASLPAADEVNSRGHAVLPRGHAEGSPDLRAFRPLLDDAWRASEEQLLRLTIGMGLRSERAVDVLQDVFLAAIERPPTIGEESDLVRWLFRVTANRCRLEHRRRGRWRRLWSSLASAWRSDVAGNNAVTSELKTEVERALAKLSADDRELVAMRYFSDLNSREIAAILGIPDTTVRTRLRAIRRRLAGELAEWNDNE